MLTPDPTRPLPAAPRPRTLVGAMIAGKYRLRRLLGTGGMGAVYKAENVTIGKTVAIKVLHHHLADQGATIARFQLEARAAASVGHENIIDVLDMGVEPNGAPYTVMEYVRGRSLAARLREEGAFEPARAAKIAGQILAGLAAVHGEGIIHRDLKPENVMLTVQGSRRDHVKLLDFGIAAIVDSVEDQRGPHDLTPSGRAMGTPLYATPEQLRGARVRDARVDIYGVGVLLFEMLTGRAPFAYKSFPELCHAIGHEPPPWFHDLGLEIDAALERVVRKALKKDPDGRWQYAEEMGEALVPFGAAPPAEIAETTDTLTMELRELRAREKALDRRRSSDRGGESPLVSGASLLALRQFLVERFGAPRVAAWFDGDRELMAIAGAAIEPARWYATVRPISLIEQIDREHLDGDRRLVAEAGRYLARAAHERGETTSRTPEMTFSESPEVWRRFFQVGDAKVVTLGRGHGRLEIRSMPSASLAISAAVVGYLDESLRLAGARDVDVGVASSRALGDATDVFEATWST